MFFKGRSAEDANKLIAALKFFLQTFSSATELQIPRAYRALRGWHRLAPNRQRLPLPWVICAAIIGVMIWQGNHFHAVSLLVQFRSYLRPGEIDRLKVKNLVRPTPVAGSPYSLWGIVLNYTEDLVAGKTGIYEASVLLDTEIWMH
eukprot:1499185-Karenia_brevis.AAC.1